MGITEGVQVWLAKVAVRKIVVSASKVLLSFLASAKVAPYLQQAGVTVDPVQLQIGLTTLAVAGLTALQDYLKLRTGARFL